MAAAMKATTGELLALPRNRREIGAAVAEAKRRVTRRAALASASALVPIPGLDIAADVATLMKLIPEINRIFGLTPEQIDQLNPHHRALVFQAILLTGGTLIGKIVTRDMVFILLKKAGLKFTTKQVARYVPFAGQALSAALSFAALKFVCHQHIAECVHVVEILRDPQQGDRGI
jgi:uncharacterized protein (DUF697 family)